MHESAQIAAVKWWKTFRQSVVPGRIAELGSYSINGSVRDFIPIDVGFDVVAGNMVDEVITAGIIPEVHRGAFKAVVSVSSFQFCPDPALYKAEILDLLDPGGFVFLTMCAPSCKTKHSTAPNPWGWTDEFRMTASELRDFFEPEIKASQPVSDDGHNLIYYGTKR